VTNIRPGRRNRSRFACTLPTANPGIRFRTRGTTWWRPEAEWARPLAETRAIALKSIAERAGDITSTFEPHDLFTAQQELVNELHHWTKAGNVIGLSIRAHITVSLTSRARQNTAVHADALRDQHRDEATHRHHLLFAHEQVMADPILARLWWLERHACDPHSITSWKSFDTIVGPLLRPGDTPEARAARIAAVLTDVFTELEADEERRALFLTVVGKVLHHMELSGLINPSTTPTAPDE
jgi:hypothetical protein